MFSRYMTFLWILFWGFFCSGKFDLFIAHIELRYLFWRLTVFFVETLKIYFYGISMERCLCQQPVSVCPYGRPYVCLGAHHEMIGETIRVDQISSFKNFQPNRQRPWSLNFKVNLGISLFYNYFIIAELRNIRFGCACRLHRGVRRSTFIQIINVHDL